MLQAVYLLCCSKKGCSSHQLHRVLGDHLQGGMVSARIASARQCVTGSPWRRWAVKAKIVEADETYQRQN